MPTTRRWHLYKNVSEKRRVLICKRKSMIFGVNSIARKRKKLSSPKKSRTPRSTGVSLRKQKSGAKTPSPIVKSPAVARVCAALCSHTIRLIISLCAFVVAITSCATQKETALVKDPDDHHDSAIPWNKQESWERGEQFAGMTDRR